MKKIPFILLIFLGLFSCQIINNELCTEQLITLSVIIVDAEGKTFKLDSTRVTRLSDNSLLTFQIDEFPDMGIYYYLTDEYFDQISTDKEEIRFEGFTPDQTLSQVFEVKQGLCHVERLSGPDTLRLD